MVNKAVFFDRDGVLNELVKHEDQYTAPWSLEEFKFIPGCHDAVKLVSYYGFKTFVVTNQPDVFDGKLKQSHLDMMTKMLEQWLSIDEVFNCMQRGSSCYKPNNGAIESLIKLHRIDRSKSYMIGDRWKDIVAGHKSGLTTIFIGKEYTYPEEYKDIQPRYKVENVLQACILIAEIENED